MQAIQRLASSFRDPSGFVFQRDGILYRQVNKIFREDYDHFINSGCYNHLVKNKWLVSHEELTEDLSGRGDCYVTLKPQKIPLISYSYEWCFDMLKDAALLTLQLVKECLAFGVILKDATPLNVQWLDGKLIFIDSLSFEKYDPSQPWIAYRQFCENFLSPLLLMHYTAQPLQSLLLTHPDGIPLSLARSLLPLRSKFSFYTYLHIHLHERLASKTAGKELSQRNAFSEKKMVRVIDSLQSLIHSLHWKAKSTWENYYEEANRRNEYIEQKRRIIAECLDEIHGLKTAIDLGANEGEFSYLLAGKNIQTIAADLDSSAVNNLYKSIRKEDEKNIIPLVVDLTNPSPASGFDNKERSSFMERIKVDVALALALIHHLAIGKNVPFEKISNLCKGFSDYLIIEFIPKQDEKVMMMLKQKKDIYNDYNEENFLGAFDEYFSTLRKETVGDSGRTIYLMKNRDKSI